MTRSELETRAYKAMREAVECYKKGMIKEAYGYWFVSEEMQNILFEEYRYEITSKKFREQNSLMMQCWREYSIVKA